MHYREKRNQLPLSYICDIFEDSFNKSYAFTYDDGIVSFVNINEIRSSKTSDYKIILNRKLTEFVDQMGLCAGISNEFSDLLNTKVHYLQAQSAVDNGLLLSKESKLFYYESYYTRKRDIVNRNVYNYTTELPEFEYRLRAQGLAMDMYLQYLGMDIAALRDSYKEGAEKQVKLRLALEKITELEKIEISDEDVETELKSYADAYDMPLDKIKTLVAAEDVKADLACRKAMDIVKETAVAGAKKKAPAKKAADDAEEEAPAEEKPAKKPAAKKTAEKKPAAKKAPAKKKAEDAE